MINIDYLTSGIFFVSQTINDKQEKNTIKSKYSKLEEFYKIGLKN